MEPQLRESINKKSQVSRLEKRFRKLDSDGNNALSVAEFLQMPELRDNPIVQRVVQVELELGHIEWMRTCI